MVGTLHSFPHSHPVAHKTFFRLCQSSPPLADMRALKEYQPNCNTPIHFKTTETKTTHQFHEPASSCRCRSAPKLSLFQQLFPIVTRPLGQLSLVLPARTLKIIQLIWFLYTYTILNRLSTTYQYIQCMYIHCIKYWYSKLKSHLFSKL